MIADILHWLGVPGKFVVLAMFAYTAWHFRHALHLAATIGTVVKIGLGFAFIGLLGVTGVVPGFRVVVDVGKLWGLGSGVADRLLDLLPRLL